MFRVFTVAVPDRHQQSSVRIANVIYVLLFWTRACTCVMYRLFLTVKQYSIKATATSKQWNVAKILLINSNSFKDRHVIFLARLEGWDDFLVVNDSGPKSPNVPNLFCNKAYTWNASGKFTLAQSFIHTVKNISCFSIKDTWAIYFSRNTWAPFVLERTVIIARCCKTLRYGN